MNLGWKWQDVGMLSGRRQSICFVEKCMYPKHHAVNYFHQCLHLLAHLNCSFGYPHFLHTQVFPHVAFVWADVICKYWPWALQKNRQVTMFERSMQAKPCLSVMHANAHSWHCQVWYCIWWKLEYWQFIFNVNSLELDLVGWENAGWICSNYWWGNGAAVQLYVPPQSNH